MSRITNILSKLKNIYIAFHGKSMNPSPANTLTREFFKMPFQHLIFRQENHFLRNAPGITKIWRVKRPRLPLSIACSCPC